MKATNGMELTFYVGKYEDMFERIAVGAFEKTTGDWYDDVTLNLPQYSLDEEDNEDAFLNDSPEIIDAMVENGYLEIIRVAHTIFGTYQVGHFTEKFMKEFGKGDEEE